MLPLLLCLPFILTCLESGFGILLRKMVSLRTPTIEDNNTELIIFLLWNCSSSCVSYTTVTQTWNLGVILNICSKQGVSILSPKYFQKMSLPLHPCTANKVLDLRVPNRLVIQFPPGNPSLSPPSFQLNYPSPPICPSNLSLKLCSHHFSSSVLHRCLLPGGTTSIVLRDLPESMSKPKSVTSA